MLHISNLTKRYGGQIALDSVDLSIAPGERVALLGHNGAGKSTLMKMVLGLLAPSGGAITVAGHAPGSRAARDLTAYLPENIAFHPALTGREQIRHFLRLRGRPASEADGLLDKVGLADAARQRIGTYSKGMRQRVGLAQALIGRAALMVLDEPTSGLDPVSRREFYALLDDLAANGTAILMSSHALSEVEVRTDRIAILSKGRKVADGSLSALRAAAALPLTVQLRPQPGQAAQLAATFPEARQIGEILTLACAQSDKSEILSRIAARRTLIEDFDFLPPSLDDIYVQISRSAA
ncbi:ABC transporter ATP-binding protein [Pseudooceanicola sp.]|uniref:ABC transporter ATP-binding protein n=1 Tax=Pseudooceanicola sp. TaxID=1914328 RepID=UPI00261A90AF|nr:ABC transporter ATP-binding protein [Pseudooceanicola sp.]MDF1856041.1 ABC transporter ATP-binding protein [Pseudooceanicola sp.]